MIVLALLLAGCAAPAPRVMHVVWVKDDARAPYSERIGADNCYIVTRTDSVPFAQFGALFRRCLETK